MENLKDFLSMSEEEKIRRIKSLDPEEVIRVLTSVGTNALSAELLNQLAVAYNNSIQPEKAMESWTWSKNRSGMPSGITGTAMPMPLFLCVCRKRSFCTNGKRLK